ncbi:hypothetical protein CANCADRAFT_937 [Tortispora caseinolytica NRRL Y-17796]|uniref:Major facilitator superfamily (MFS) profile domain-containing protein n=1 Tax=Tortispora caseinolytica NRRL Y-17796 TaxID=767744 RepID=A0A1E4TKR3_9ASCO|nr:hypothetical protein CANCADRAFT_937 [Tortispora caseinolytica NRRL Y-17796]
MSDKDAALTHNGLPIPGTVYLLDLEQNLNNVVHGSQKEIVLVPQPTKDPNDPLNWSNMRKWITFFWPSWYTFFVAVLAAALSPAYLDIAEGMGVSLDVLVNGSGYLFLLFGVGNLIMQPLALNYGRRMMFTWFAIIGGVAFSIWFNFITEEQELYGNRVLTGFFLAPVESLQEVIVGDLFFAHERGFYMGVYVWVLMGGTYLGPLASSFVNGSMGWQWINYFFAIFIGAGAIGSFFFMEETMYYRPNAIKDQIAIDEAKTHHHMNVDESLVVPITSIASANGDVIEKSGAVTSTSISDDSEAQVEEYRTKSFWEMRPILYTKIPGKPNSMIKSMYRPILILFYFPPVLWAGITVASSLSWFMVLTGTVASIFSAPPYNFGTTGLGLLYFSPFIGICIAVYLGGDFTDKLALKLARRNGGVREPEMRLWTGIIALITTPVGMWMYGIGAARGNHWIVPVLGFGIAAIGNTLAASLPYTYALDCYKEFGGDVMVSIILVRNLMGFGFAYAITPWVNHSGLQNCFIVVGILAFVFWIPMFPMIWWGKKSRAHTAQRAWIYAKDASH